MKIILAEKFTRENFRGVGVKSHSKNAQISETVQCLIALLEKQSL